MGTAVVGVLRPCLRSGRAEAEQVGDDDGRQRGDGLDPVGAAFCFAMAGFMGFESGAIYGEECRNPRRTIPRATYAAVILMGVFYAVSAWALAVGAGPGHVVGAAQEQGPGLFFALGAVFLTALINFDVLLGAAKDSALTWSLPCVLLAAGTAGVVFGRFLKSRRPHVYTGIGHGADEGTQLSDGVTAEAQV
ncbi:amino acid permease [Streptomyces nigrescens]|uniref:amino acid permease n=1 Tax=Streptomyces nigrescens TaxID=1920 RepID=UPI0034996373